MTENTNGIDTSDVTPPAETVQFNPGMDADELAAGFRNTSQIFEYTQTILNDPNKPLHEKFNALQRLNFALLPALLALAYSVYPNADRSVVIARTKMMIDSQAKLLQLEADAKNEANIDPTSPKFHLITQWYIEAVRLAVLDTGIPDSMRNVFFRQLADRLTGFEQRIASSLNGAAGKALNEIQNPFTKKFFNSLLIDHEPPVE